MKKNNFSIIIQLRNGSKRLPGKALMKYIIISLFLLTACNKVDVDPSTTILKQVLTNGKNKK